MLACVTRVAITPGVQTGSGKASPSLAYCTVHFVGRESFPTTRFTSPCTANNAVPTETGDDVDAVVVASAVDVVAVTVDETVVSGTVRAEPVWLQPAATTSATAHSMMAT